MSFSHAGNDDNNNNNNLQTFYEGVLPQFHQVMDNPSHVRSFGIGGMMHAFTFASPTQGTTAPTPRQAIQTTCAMPFGWAPGMGTTWQHSHPATLSMANGSSNGGISSVFTGMPVRTEPQPSCSSPMKRPKRKAQSCEDAPSSKVYLCTDKFANLNLNTDSVYQPLTGGRNHDPLGWGRFQEVEGNIECDEEDGEADDDEEGEQEGVLHIDETVAESLSSNMPASILPPCVVEKISKPCMQVVLWKSPGQLVRDFVREDISLPVHNPSQRPSPPSSPSKNSHHLQTLSPLSQTLSTELQAPSAIHHSPWSSQSHYTSPIEQINYTVFNQDSSMWDNNFDLDLNDEDMQL